MSQATIDQLGITMSTQWIARRTDGLMADMPGGSNHWIITLTRNAEMMTFQFSQGPAIKGSPTLGDVLECIASDWASACQPFAEWCREYGYDIDEYDEDADEDGRNPSKARRIYDAVQAQTLDLERLFSDDPDFDAAQFWDFVNE